MSGFSGFVWRHLPKGGDPFHFYWPSTADGRWNRPGKYGALYTSLTERGSLAEYVKLRREMGPAVEQQQLIKIEIEVEDVLDLTDGRTRRRFDVSVADLTGDSTRSYRMCRSIADEARYKYISAIRAPSAAVEGEENLNIYQWGEWRTVGVPQEKERKEITEELLKKHDLIQ